MKVQNKMFSADEVLHLLKANNAGKVLTNAVVLLAGVVTGAAFKEKLVAVVKKVAEKIR